MQRYDVIVNGTATTLLLSDADAAKRGLTKPAPAVEVEVKEAKAPANKSRKPANKSTAVADEAAVDVQAGDE